jgi:hypothetical protein
VIDIDLYNTNQSVEELLESLKLNLRKDYSPIKVYVSTASPYEHWLQKLYNIYNSTNLMEVQKDAFLF